MGNFFKKIFGLFSGDKSPDASGDTEQTKPEPDAIKSEPETDPVTVAPDIAEPDIAEAASDTPPPPQVDIYASIMMAEAEPTADEEIDATISGILAVIKDAEDDPELDEEEKDLRRKIAASCHEILAEQNQALKMEKIGRLLSVSSGMTAISIFTIRLRQMTDL